MYNMLSLERYYYKGVVLCRNKENLSVNLDSRDHEMALSYFRTCSTITGCRADDSKDTKIRKRSVEFYMNRERRIVFIGRREKKISDSFYYICICHIYGALEVPLLIDVKLSIEHKYNFDRCDC